MEFRTFLNAIMRVPAQIVRTGRCIVFRLLAWNRSQRVFLRGNELRVRRVGHGGQDGVVRATPPPQRPLGHPHSAGAVALEAASGPWQNQAQPSPQNRLVMVRFVVYATVFLALASARAAGALDFGHIGIYTDPLGIDACAEIPTGQFVTLYVLAERSDDSPSAISGAEFRIEVTHPQDWVINYTQPEGSILIGNPIDGTPGERHDGSGANVAFTVCSQWNAAGRVGLGTLFVYNAGGTPTELLVKRRSVPSNRSSPCALFTACDAPYYTKWCNTPRLAVTCTDFGEAADASGGGECDAPYFVFGLGRVPDPRWTTRPPARPIGSSNVIAMLGRRTYIELPEGEHWGTLDDANVRVPALRRVLEDYGVARLAKFMPCFDLADTVLVTRTGDVVRLTDWSKFWVFTTPRGASVSAFIEDLSRLREVVFAEPDGYAVAQSFTPSLRTQNPAVKKATLAFEITQPMPGRVEIFDVAGRRVKLVLERRLTAGPNIAIWDGTHDDGRSAENGVYFVRITAGDRSSTRKLVFLR
jgi:hypothetical protein